MGSNWKGAGTVLLFDLGAGYKRCIHSVKIQLAGRFVRPQQNE